MNSSKTKTFLIAALLVSAAIRVEGQHTADEIARAIVIGQAYTSGNVYVGGFSGGEKPEWPARVMVTALRTANALPLTAEFTRALAPDSDEQMYFPQREDGGSAGPEDLFSTIDGMVVTDPNLALYRSLAKVNAPFAVFGWSESIAIGDVSFSGKGRPRPTTAAERAEIAETKKKAPPIADCTTEPQFLDSAEVILTARVAKTKLSIRLSTYQTPGCAGHLADVYVLDVIEPGRDPRRFEFSHYVGLL